MTATIEMRRPDAATRSFDATTVPGRQRVRWPWYLAGAACLQYLVTALWLVNTKGFLIADGVERTANAMAIVLSRDPHLGAMGLYWMPLPMLIRIPILVLLRPFHAGVYAGPIASSIAGALVIPVLAKIGRVLGIGTVLSAGLITLYALNPVTTWHAANGMSESWFAFCYALLLLAFVKLVTGDPDRRSTNLRHVGLALGLGVASRFEFLPVCAAVAVAVSVQVPKSERRQAIVMVVIPPAFIFFFWSLASSLLAGDAFLWYTLNKAYGKTPEFHPWMPADLTLTSITEYIVSVSFLFSPALLFGLVLGAFQRRNWRPFVGLVLVVVAYPGVNWYQLVGKTGVGAMRYFGLIPLLGTVVVMWVLRDGASSGRSRTLITSALVASTLIGLVTVTYTLANPVRTQIEKESVFFAPLIGRPSPEYKRNLDGLEQIASILDAHLTAGRRVAMDSKGGWLTLYSQHPERFILPYDRDWEKILSDPDGRFDFVVKPTLGIGGLEIGSAYTSALERAMNEFTGGAFQLVAQTEAAELWEFVPTDGTPTVQSTQAVAPDTAASTTTEPTSVTTIEPVADTIVDSSVATTTVTVVPAPTDPADGSADSIAP